MLCTKCGAPLTEQDYCANCGEDVKIYKKLARISNTYYNAGLAKANVRDLSGAIQDLKYSLEINKYNTQARNLLGLIYFEMGEVVDALTEWIISKNLEPKKNTADEYIKAIQESPAQLETMNQTIKKYNQALTYCQQGSDDLAIIQLKKVLSLNPRLVKAHQLLALLYIKTENYDRARRELKRALDIDGADTVSLRYQQELDARLEKSSSRADKKKDIISYTSGNETIIMPAAYKDSPVPSVVVNLIIGLLVGVALMWFLVIPAKIKTARSDANQQVVEYSDQLSAKQASLDSMEQELAAANARIAELEAEPEVDEEALNKAERLLEAAIAYNSKDNETAKTLLAEVNAEELTDVSRDLYGQLNMALNPEAAKANYDEGSKAYDDGDHARAIELLEPIVNADPSYETGYALYYLARAYESTGQNEEAIRYFTQFVALFPGTARGTYCKNALERLQGTTGQSQGGQPGTGGQQGQSQTGDQQGQSQTGQQPQGGGQEQPQTGGQQGQPQTGDQTGQNPPEQ